MTSINESSLPITRWIYETFDDSGYQVGSTDVAGGAILLVIRPQEVACKPAPKAGRRLKDLLAQRTKEVSGFQEARRWVADAIYGEASQSFQSIRLRLGLSQTELARLARTTQTRISKIENGDEIPRFDTMEKLALALQIDMNALSVAIRIAAKRKVSE